MTMSYKRLLKIFIAHYRIFQILNKNNKTRKTEVKDIQDY